MANRNHPLNVGRTNWWLTLPDYIEGGCVWRDLMGKTHMFKPGGATQGTLQWHFNGPLRQHSAFMGGSNICYMDAQQSKFVYPTAAFTFMAWVKQNGTPFSTMICGEEVSGAATSCRFWMQAQKLSCKITTTISNYTATGATTNAGSTWLHAAVTYNGSNALTVYLNGVSDGTATPSGTLTPPSTQAFHLGRNANFGDRWNGWMNDVGVWRRALSASEIKQYIAASRRDYEGLLIRQALVAKGVTVAPVFPDAYGTDFQNVVCGQAASRRRNIVYSLPGSWSILPTLTPEAITLDKFHVPLAQPPRPRAQNRPRMETVARGHSPELPQPDPFFLPLDQPPRLPPARQLRGFAQARGELGDVERAEEVVLSKFDVALAQPPRPTLARRERVYALVRGVLGDVPRIDAEGPITTVLQPWYAPLALPVWHQLVRRPRPHTFPFFAYGEPPAPEPVTVDRFLSQTRLPVWLPRRLPHLVEFTPDMARLGDAEVVLSTSWDVAMGRVVLARRPPLWIPGSEQTLRDVWPDPPESNTMPPWHVELAQPVRLPRVRDRREFFPDGALLLHPDLVFEEPGLKFHAPLAIPQLRRKAGPPAYPAGGIDLDAADRPEVLFHAAYLVRIDQPQLRHRRRLDLSRAVLAFDPALLAEAVHADALLRDDPRVGPRTILKALQGLFDNGWLLSDNFEVPLIVRVRLGMLAGGLWRARG